MNVARRQFLKNSLALAGAAAIGGCRDQEVAIPEQFQSIGTAVGGIVGLTWQGLLARQLMDYQLVIVDFSKASVNKLSLPFSPHSIARHPQNTHTGLAVSMPDFSSRYGYHGDYTKACLIDFKKNEVIRYIESPKDRYFFGHAVFNSNGHEAVFISDNYDRVSKRSYPLNQATLDVLDLETGKCLEQIETGGTIVHDACRALNERDIIAPRNVVGEKGIKPEIAFYNLQTKKTERVVRFADVNDYALAHFRQTPQETLFVQAWTPLYSNKKARLLFAKKNDEKFKVIEHSPEIEKRITWEPPMEVCTHQLRPVTAVSWVKFDFVAFYDNYTGDFIGHVDVPGPTAVVVSRDHKYFIVQAKGRFRFINAETLREEEALFTAAPTFNEFIIDYFKHGLVV